ncbi:competence type IV pilus major pilin ComGC [Amphibacillus cookii]|uniref:competence type IV pilus major pilin ComGC n=1 Tax=Amphibacillus cookii TaxID=767787 RepID=UPI00195E0696|nr:prepilin-type N-terminal cleavage/methylation domain-containing protein [Amphibacillus cookii]MBM7541790.1 type IV pilus assembly protein PilA [Amphibacillus cookii]
MLSQMKKMLKGEKGFTLVELLAVIVILGIIVAIAIPAIGNIIKNAQGDADEQEVALILDAARLYEVQNENGLPVDVDTLISEGYLDLRQGDAPSGTVDRDADGKLELK